ncbi:hypothetical protein SNE25_07345 [Mucilaginibacter sabulilitoris]|uniref:Lipocalin-like domain-containing protein n=1 Tax=Mucilaginibacter sabulilitoris TaxID=1173583 RepID=A0ABZ0TQE0_9SPHI|nr:hypothetical protein [Mucilaginibacter sabulilitoris]WPU95338.1 hypothetical protein SNE25_07345 [Mucilaginibacter sabulilitoris]
MMKYFVLLITVCALCSVSSCNKEKLPHSDSIVGEWRWVKSVGGIGGFTLTPKTEGFTQKWVFNADSTFKSFKNDSLTIQGKFSIVRNYKYSESETVDVLKWGNSIDDSFVIRNDTLFTNNIFISDGFGSTYVRIK